MRKSWSVIPEPEAQSFGSVRRYNAYKGESIMAKPHEIQYINAYVSGNIAYQMDVQPARKKRVRLPKPKAKKQMVLHVDPVAVGGILVAAVMLVLLVVGFVRLQDARAEAAVAPPVVPPVETSRLPVVSFSSSILLLMTVT